jgi:hypothetical protein
VKYPPLLKYKSEQEYYNHFVKKYCSKDSDIRTFDGYRVHFKKSDFKHAFFKSADRRKPTKDLFSLERAKRMDWIEIALIDKSAELYIGWDNRHNKLDKKRRVCIVQNNFVIIISMNRNKKKGFFITEYVAEESTLEKLRDKPKWT